MQNKEQKETRRGFYSPIKVALAFLIFTLVFVFLTSHSLYVRASNIQNKQLKTILTSILQPIDTFATKLGVNTFFDNSRKALLHIAQLEKIPDWEEFYYVEEGGNMQDETLAMTSAENNKSVGDTEKTKTSDSDVIKESGNQEELVNDEVEDRKNKIEETEMQDEVDEGVDYDLKQEATDDLQEEPSPSPYLYDENKPFRILMVGDSQMYSIANGLKKLTAGQDAIEITDFSIQSSGFIRGDYYNWEKKIANIFSEQESGYYHVAVVLLGMNDYQDIFYGNTYLVRETKGWEERYRDKIVRVMNLLLLHTKKVYWLGMPIVRRGTYNDDLRYIDSVQEAVAKEYHHSGLKRVSLANIAPGEGVPFTETIQKEDGNIIRLMKSDGVHYTLAGGEYIMSSFLKDLYSEWYIKP